MKGTRPSRHSSQIATPMAACDENPYTIAFRCAGRTRPKVSHDHPARKSGECIFQDASSARTVPAISHNRLLTNRNKTGQRHERSISASDALLSGVSPTSDGLRALNKDGVRVFIGEERPSDQR